MSRALPVVLAVCCVLSMGIAHPAADSPSPATEPATQSAACTDDPHLACVPNTSNYLSVNASAVVVVTENDTSLDVASAVATDVSSLTSRLTQAAIETEYRSAPPEARQAVLERYTAALANRTADLRAAERAALRAFNDGDITARQYLRTLAEIDATADRLWESSQFVKDEWSTVTGQYGRDPSAAIRADLYGLRGSLRDDLQSVYAGRRSSLRVHVTTTDSGFVLGAFVESGGRETFRREAYLGDVRRRSTGPDRYGGDAVEAATRIQALYPWAFSDEGLSVRGNAGTYTAPKRHAHGSTTVFLDGESGHVFAEHQVMYLDRVPISSTNQTNASNGLTVTLEQTHCGGPLSVTVNDVTGERVAATVTVNGRSVGETGADGTLWTVTPYANNVVVRATHDGETVTIVRFARN